MHEFFDLVRNPGHWMFEGVSDLVFTGVALLIGRVPFRRWLARHDKEKHNA